jgi:F-type H+-transporting ATPase subunit b
MNVAALAAQSSGGGQLQEIARTFGVDWPHLAAQVISFSIVCLLLYLFAYKPVLRMLAARREQIAQGLANTERINATLAQMEAQRREVLAAAHADAARLIEEARNVARRVKEEQTRRASAAAEAIVDKARDAAAQEHVRMIDELRREVGHLVVKTTAAVTGKILSPDDQRRLAAETARELT